MRLAPAPARARRGARTLGIPRTTACSRSTRRVQVLDRHPGVVTPDDPIDVIESVARAYDTRWLVIEQDDAARALGPVLAGDLTVPWIGAPVFTVPDRAGGAPKLALYPVCTTTGDTRCAGSG